MNPTTQHSPAVHLTDDQFADCLMGLPASPAVNAHLASCERCRQEVGGFQTTVDQFSAAAMGWSESQPVPSLRAVVAPARQGFSLFTPARLSMAMALLFAVGTGVLVEHHHVSPAETPITASATTSDSAAQIAQDNQLLQSVDMALTDNDPSPFREYQLQDSATRVNTKLTPARHGAPR